MDKLQAERNAKLFYIFQLLREPLFWGPIMIIYINRVSGMSLSSIYFMEAVVLIALFLFEIPSGAIADLLGRRKTMLIGYSIMTLDNLMFSLATNPLMIWTADFIWVIGYSLVSGADSAFLYDSLLYLGRKEDYKKIFGRTDAYRLALVSVCSISVGYLASLNIRFPIILSTFFILVNVVVVYFFREPPLIKRQATDWFEYKGIIQEGFKVIFKVKKLLWIIAFTVLVLVVSKLWFFTYNMYFEAVDLPLIYFGWIFFLLNMVAALVSHNVDWLEKRFGELGSMILMIVTISIPMLLMGYYVSMWATLMVLWQNISRGLIKPFSDDSIHNNVASENRATAISIKSAAAGIGQFFGLMIFSFSLDLFGLIDSIRLLGWFTLVAGVSLIYFFRKKNGKK